MALPQPQPGGSAPLRLFLGLFLLLLAATPANNTNITITDTFVSVTAGAPHPTETTPWTMPRVLETINTTVPKQVEYGVCTVTCGIGIREVILTSGCPGAESKCLVRVEECRGPSDCGWGKPISESLESMKMGCIYIPPENRFTYIWKMLIPDQQSLILPNDSAIMEVHRKSHPVSFQCDTKEHNSLIATVKYTVYTTAELESRRMGKPNTDVLLTFVLIAGIIVVIGVILAIIFITLNWASVKSFWEAKLWKTGDQGSSEGSLRAFDEPPGNQITGEASQTSQLEAGREGTTASFHEWETEGGKETY